MNYLKKILALFDRIELDGLTAHPDSAPRKKWITIRDKEAL
ncbi:hypothetical protein SAMN05421743_102168 [Thalassobacillus cyri]|uniref:Uncharacterized protein n=1 Tax=Thalassobacillus cyri TaxID=571932 RepID=A0A1H3XLC2_9BACI|nr:hypothetical protein [Thalassobacillus cyri]SDZ99414.1 hypothetical protein SAMN05421743_102168 [Thalassobacillus cyri]